MKHRMAGLGLVACILGGSFAGCERPPTDSSASQPAQSRPNEKLSADAVERLRSMPYSGFVPDEDDAGAVGVVLCDAQRSQPGFTLYTMERLSTAELIDQTGKSVRTWKDPNGLDWYHTELVENGDLLVVGATKGASGGRELPDEARYLARYAWDGTLIWKSALPTHHDVELTPDGKLMTMTIRRRVEPAVHAEITLRDEELVRVEPDSGKPIEAMSLYDAIRAAPDVFKIKPAQPKTRGGVTEIDLLHSNSVESMRHAALAARDPLYAAENVLVCFRHQDQVAVFNWRERRAVWAWGDGILSGPHDAQMLAGGNILVFDNGIERKYSRVLEVNPLTREIVWSYQAADPRTFFTLTKGSAQRLANGNTLIANSDSGRAFEVTHAGEKVWEFVCPHRGARGERATIVRAIRHSREMIDAILSRKAAPPPGE